MIVPIYTWSTEEGTLTEAQKVALAKAVTDIHCSATAAPQEFVRVIFSVYPRSSGFVGHTAAAPAVLVCKIRAGRSLDTKHSIMRQLNQAATELGGIASDALAIVMEDIAPGHGMEYGQILPDIPREQGGGSCH
jgi:phenylpyruvate tautomerase PptA (4-oxalocrotonate tautomerase family)